MSKRSKNAGRPTVITDTVLRKLREAFLMGMSDREACIYSGIGESTLYDYQRENEAFSEQKRAWKSNNSLQAKRNISEKIMSGDIEVSKWWLQRRNKSEFSLSLENQKSNLEERPTDPWAEMLKYVAEHGEPRNPRKQN